VSTFLRVRLKSLALKIAELQPKDGLGGGKPIARIG
jgi:hypothetical protein